MGTSSSCSCTSSSSCCSSSSSSCSFSLCSDTSAPHLCTETLRGGSFLRLLSHAGGVGGVAGGYILLSLRWIRSSFSASRSAAFDSTLPICALSPSPSSPSPSPPLTPLAPLAPLAPPRVA